MLVVLYLGVCLFVEMYELLFVVYVWVVSGLVGLMGGWGNFV